MPAHYMGSLPRLGIWGLFRGSAGPQPPLLNRELFEAVQRRLTEQRSHHVTTRTKTDALLKGILFDAAGDPMVPTHATKQGVRYRYYVSQPYLRGLATPPIGAIVRVPAADIEAVVSKALREYLAPSNTPAADQPSIRAMVSRIEVRNSHLALWLLHPGADGVDESAGPPAPLEENSALLIPWTKPPAKRFKEILLPASSARSRARPMKAERRTVLIKSIARGRAWLDEIVSGNASIEDIAARQKCSVRQVNMTISMAFIAPALIKAAVEGRLPRGIGVANLRDAPAEWSLQFERLGLAQP